MRYAPRWSWLMILGFFCVAIAILPGCPAPVAVKDTKTSASIQVGDVVSDIARAQADLTGPQGVLPTVNAITPANAAVQVPVAVAKVQTVDSDLKIAATQASSAGDKAAATEKVVAGQATEITKLQESNPVKTWLELIGIAAIVGGVGFLIAGIFVTYLQAITWLRSAAVGAIAFGLCLVSIAWFLTAIMWIVFGCIGAAIIFGVVWIVTHKTIRNAIAADVEGWFKINPAQVAAVPGLADAIGVKVATTTKLVPATPSPTAPPAPKVV